jgi:hypothetical protein
MRMTGHWLLGTLACGCLVCGLVELPRGLPGETGPAGTKERHSDKPAVQATEFESRKVYQSAQRPGYTSWVSFFPGESGQWYLTCEEVTRPKKPLPQCSRQQWYEMSLPVGYDKSQYRMQMVMLESRDQLKTWKVISREPCRFQHSAGSFGQARTNDGRFLRFVWSCYALDPAVKANEIFYESGDNARTWKKMPAFHDPHFASYPHRLRTLRDGTLVLAVPLAPRWGRGTDRPVRASMRLDTPNDMQMTLFFSHDQGRTWNGPLPVFGGQNVSETDFVELPNGNLLLFNNSIFAHPGRQMLYRSGSRFTPGPLERVRSGQVPETVGLTKDGILVGCMRPGSYSWSGDLGQTWQALPGIPERGPEVYQPWLHVLDDGRIACAGHFGADDPIGGRDQYVSIHFFRLNVLRKTKDAHIVVERAFDEAKKRWRNRYTLTLTSSGPALPDKELEFWYVQRGKPGYDSYNKHPLSERMKAGGVLIKVRTDRDGKASVDLPHLDAIKEIHYSYQLVVLFNRNRTDPSYKPAQTAQLEFYANHYQDPPLQ